MFELFDTALSVVNQMVGSTHYNKVGIGPHGPETSFGCSHLRMIRAKPQSILRTLQAFAERTSKTGGYLGRRRL